MYSIYVFIFKYMYSQLFDSMAYNLIVFYFVVLIVQFQSLRTLSECLSCPSYMHIYLCLCLHIFYSYIYVFISIYISISLLSSSIRFSRFNLIFPATALESIIFSRSFCLFTWRIAYRDQNQCSLLSVFIAIRVSLFLGSLNTNKLGNITL